MSQYLDDIRQGDDYTINIKFTSGLNIAGYEFWFTVKNNFTDLDASAVLQHTYIAPTNTDTAQGILTFNIPNNKTATVPQGYYYYDIQMKDTTGLITTILPPVGSYDDQIQFVPDVTKSIV